MRLYYHDVIVARALMADWPHASNATIKEMMIKLGMTANLDAVIEDARSDPFASRRIWQDEAAILSPRTSAMCVESDEDWRFEPDAE